MSPALLQTGPSLTAGSYWGLDRLDQRSLPLNNGFNYQSAGKGVHVYVLDSGIDKDNSDFAGRVELGPNEVTTESPTRPDSLDCSGSGTSHAGLIGGARFGLAKAATLVSVRIFDCQDRAGNSDVPNGVQWVIDHGTRPAVMYLDIGRNCADESGNPNDCPEGFVSPIVAAEQRALDAGIPVVLDAGNTHVNSCDVPVPAPAGAIEVGAVNHDDSYWANSDFGSCVDIWAPGENLDTDALVPHNGVRQTFGTSAAAAYVTGAVAALLGTGDFDAVPTAQLAAKVSERLDANATLGQITNLLDGSSPNKLLYSPPTLEGSSVAAVKTSAGVVQAFGTNAAGQMYSTVQTARNATTWTKWSASANSGWLSVGAGRNFDNRVQLVGVDVANQVWQRQQIQTERPVMTAWSQLGGRMKSIAAVNGSFATQIELVGVDTDGKAWHAIQTSENTPSFGSWIPFAGGLNPPRFISVAAEADSSGVILAVLVDSHGQLWETTQLEPNSSEWLPVTSFASFGREHIASEVALARDSAGGLDLLAIGPDGMWQSRATVPGALSWGEWSLVAGVPNLMHIAAEDNDNGTVLALTVDSDGHVFQNSQNAPGSSAYTLRSLDGVLRP
ncbi:S8 family serine peptidase [Kribbella sp. NBC_00359]|uniref:S8 family serine peptidase n=1 Tax=Kribbella sp. NBC_00359 TaxID=2975966 RepID=UPI002E1B96B7